MYIVTLMMMKLRHDNQLQYDSLQEYRKKYVQYLTTTNGFEDDCSLPEQNKALNDLHYGSNDERVYSML